MAARLAEQLVSRGLLTASSVEEAQRRRASYGGGLDTALLELDALGEPALLAACADASGLRAVNLADFEPNREMSRFVPANVAERLAVVPLSEVNGVLHVACAYPPPLRDLEEVSLLLGRKLELWVALEVRVRNWIAAVYHAPLPPRFAALLARLDPSRAPPRRPPPAASEAPTEEDVPFGEVVVFPSPAAPQRIETPPPQGDLPVPPVGELEAAPRPIPTDLPPSPEAPPEWTLEDAREALGHAADRDQIIWVALQFARRTFEFAAAFAVVRGAAVGWAAEGPHAEAFKATPPTIPLDAPSLFRTVAVTRGGYLGPPPADVNTGSFLAQLGRAPRTVFLFPVEVNGRVVCLVYADPGARAASQRRLSEVVLLCQELSAAFARVILHRKQQYASRLPAGSLEEAAAQVMGWSPRAQGELVTWGRAASMAAPVVDVARRAPADFTPLLRRLTGPDASARTAAVAELARTPEASARFLASQFPGPTAWSRLAVADLPEPEELGPVPAALSRLGRAGAAALAPLLDSNDLDVRYFALLTAGNLPFAELVGGVLRGLFDPEPEIASAARAAAGALRRVPRFALSIRDLRQELASADTMRRCLAARALGVLRDRDSVEALTNLTGSDDGACAEAAAEALSEITGQDFGPDQHAWTRWWAEHRARSRSEWLVGALRHPEVKVRLRALGELASALNDGLGYDPDAPAPVRERAVQRWEAAVRHDPRLRRLD